MVDRKGFTMSTTLERPFPAARPAPLAGLHVRTEELGDARYQAFLLMRLGYTVLPLAMGIDKFFNGMVFWPKYLAGWINDIAPGTAQQFMYFVGAVEIVAGLLVLLKPRYAAYVVAAWLAGIVTNLWSGPGYWDVGLRDVGLLLGALTLGRLASHYDPPLFGRRQS
jgi:uncharacterized membrane protein YphA (DoxX/SURF4 family)